MVSDTQIDSWNRLQSELAHRQKDVYSYIIENKGAAAFEISDFLRLPLHSISGRITELRKLGKICDSGIRLLNRRTNRNVIVWTADMNRWNFLHLGRDAGPMSMTSEAAQKAVTVDASIAGSS